MFGRYRPRYHMRLPLTTRISWAVLMILALWYLGTSQAPANAGTISRQLKAHPELRSHNEPSHLKIQSKIADRSYASDSQVSTAGGPLRVDETNGRYFTDGGGRAILLSGSHTWLNLQDGVLTDPPPAFDYTGWLDFLVAHHHNFIRLWDWEQAKWVAE